MHCSLALSQAREVPTLASRLARVLRAVQPRLRPAVLRVMPMCVEAAHRGWQGLNTGPNKPGTAPIFAPPHAHARHQTNTPHHLPPSFLTARAHTHHTPLSGNGYYGGGYTSQQQAAVAYQRQQQALAAWQAAQAQAPPAEPGLAPSATADKPLALQAWLEERVRFLGVIF